MFCACSKLRLLYLLQYTSGVSNSLVKGCQYMQPNEGYAGARKLLRKTFRQKFRIDLACISNTVSGPR